MQDSVAAPSPSLFWDVDQSKVDAEKNARWLIERVLQRGTWENWLIIKRLYDKPALQEIKPRLRLDPKSKIFFKIYLES